MGRLILSNRGDDRNDEGWLTPSGRGEGSDAVMVGKCAVKGVIIPWLIDMGVRGPWIVIIMPGKVGKNSRL
jgi:hypothetical protein